MILIVIDNIKNKEDLKLTNRHGFLVSEDVFEKNEEKMKPYLRVLNRDLWERGINHILCPKDFKPFLDGTEIYFNPKRLESLNVTNL